MLFEKQSYQQDCVNYIASIVEGGVNFVGYNFTELKPSLEKHYNLLGYKHFNITDHKRLDVLMETGTGKTFTYIQTIFELNKRFNQNRFIIIVPRNAIKAGVIQNIKLTKEYFFNAYGKHLNVIEYPKDGIASVEFDFLGDDSRISVLVLNSGAFANKDAVLNRLPEAGWLHQHGTVWNAIAHKRPVVIIDEPHLLKGKETTASLEKLSHSLFIRFGATYPTDKGHELSNVAYALDSISAFNEYLVKRIRVNTLLSDSESGAYMLANIEAGGKKDNKSFSLTYFLEQENYLQKLKLQEDIGAKTGIKELLGVHATKVTQNNVYLSNGMNLELNNDFALSDDEVRLMLRSTINKHFEKEEYLFNKNIKALSLFFIPNVHDFRGSHPRIKMLFEDEYKQKRAEVLKTTQNQAYKAYLQSDIDEDGQLRVHEGYFSGDGQGKGSADEKLGADIELILNKKEELLQFKNPLRFIFSVWALQEGWDNPNIFTICKLAPTKSETSRRQQVGRGLRLAVNQDGKRLTYKSLGESEHAFYEINTLDMVVSKHELNFIQGIQSEIQQASYTLVGDVISHDILVEKTLTSREASKLLAALEDKEIITYNEPSDDYIIQSSIHEFLVGHGTSLKFLSPERLGEIKTIFKENVISVENGNSKKNRRTVKVKPEQWQAFQELWEAINRKSKIVYANLQEELLIKNISEAFNKEKIHPVELKVVTKEYNTQTNTINTLNETTLQDNLKFFTQENYTLLANTLMKDSKLMLPLHFVINLLNQLNKEIFAQNPKEATKRLKTIITAEIHKSVIQTVDYQFSPETRITELQDKDTGAYLAQFKHTLLGRKFSTEVAPNHLLYDTVVYDSEIERTIQLNDPKSIGNNSITVFAKLPKISIPTPYSSYNPDFAYLVSRPNGKTLFLVVETKGYTSESEIPAEEAQKIQYAETFFRQLQAELPDVEIAFKKRVNKTELTTILQEIEQGNKAA